MQVILDLLAIDKDHGGGQETPVHFSIPPESSSALNLTIRESGGATNCFFFFLLNPETDMTTICCAVTMVDVCAFFVYIFIRCDSQPGAPVSLRAPPWLLLILTHPLRASCAA